MPIETPSNQNQSTFPETPKPKITPPETIPMTPAAPSEKPAPSPSKSPSSPDNFAGVNQVLNKIKSQSIPPQTPIDTPPAIEIASEKSPLLTLLTNRLFLIGTAIVIIAIIIISLGYYYFFYNIGTLSLTLNTSPDKLTVNSQSYPLDISQKTTLAPGNYTLVAEKTGHLPITKSFIITAQKETKLTVDLIPFPAPVEVIEYTTSFPYINPAETEISYLSNFATTFYKVNLQSYIKDIISPQNFNGINNIHWAPAARQACIIEAKNNPRTTDFQEKNSLYIADRPLDSTIFHFYDFSKYDFVSQQLISYPDTIHNPRWHPSKEEIIFHFIDPATGENTLAKAKPTLENKEVITDLDMNNARVDYSPNALKIAILDTDLSDTAEPNPIFLFDVLSRKMEKIPTKDQFQNFIWSPDSSKIIGILKDNSLALIDPATLNTTNLSADITADIDHLNWFSDSQKIIVCTDITASADKLIIYDINSGTTKEVITDNSLTFNNISHPIVTSDNQSVYFIGDGHLYNLNIFTE